MYISFFLMTDVTLFHSKMISFLLDWYIFKKSYFLFS